MTSKANIEALREALEAYRRDAEYGAVVKAAWACGMERGEAALWWTRRFLAEHKESGDQTATSQP